MDNLKIRFDVRGDNQTTSLFVVGSNGNVQFANEHDTAALKVSIDGATTTNSPLCRGNSPVAEFEVLANKRETLHVCGGDGWNSFKYTATLGDAAPEDPIVVIDSGGTLYPEMNPIVVIDRDILNPDNFFSAAAGFLLGIALAVIVANRFRMSGPPPRG